MDSKKFQTNYCRKARLSYLILKTINHLRAKHTKLYLPRYLKTPGNPSPILYHKDKLLIYFYIHILKIIQKNANINKEKVNLGWVITDFKLLTQFYKPTFTQVERVNREDKVSGTPNSKAP